MRLLHTADWHLGKTLKGANLHDDQKFIIDQIFDIIDKQKVDSVIIAGDIYDRAVPPIEAVNLFNDTLNRFAERNLPTFIISGNHDSAARLNFGSKIFADKKIFIASKADESLIVPLKDDFGEIFFTLLPFAEPDALAKMIQNVHKGRRNVAVAHAFLTGGVESESERKFVGGSANVDAQLFNGFDYVALGHLHRPQKISAENIRYAGSPLKYSFDEADHKKSVTIVELDAQGFVNAEKIPLKPLHNVIVEEGQFAELVNRPTCEDYAQIILTDDIYIYETELLRDAFPNFLEVKRKSHLHSYDDEPANNFNKEDSISEQFAKFFQSVTNEPLTDDERTAFEKFLLELERNEREA